MEAPPGPSGASGQIDSIRIMQMQLFLQQAINGVMLGGMFSLMSIGLTMMFGIMKTANFAYGALYMIGGYAAFWASSLLGTPYWLSLLIAFVVGFGMGIAVEVIGFRRFRGNEDATLVFGLGVALVARGGSVLAWGSQTRYIPTSFAAYHLGPFILPSARIWAALASVVIVLAVYLIVVRTKWGRVIRAVADNSERAQLVGFDTSFQYALVAGLATGLSAVACVFLIPVFSLSPTVDDSALYTAMTIVILGGLGSIVGCGAGGFIIGVVTAFSFGYLNSTIAPMVPLLLLLIVLAVRPEGLFGRRERAV
jgi:branched-chain amino acid transport system permease protein